MAAGLKTLPIKGVAVRLGLVDIARRLHIEAPGLVPDLVRELDAWATETARSAMAAPKKSVSTMQGRVQVMLALVDLIENAPAYYETLRKVSEK